ncbi:MAG: hypothetical protein ABI601_08980 [bacterium]
MSRARVLILLAPVLLASTRLAPLAAQQADVVRSSRVLPLTLLGTSGEFGASTVAVRMTPLAPVPRAAAAEGQPSGLGNAFRAVIGVGAGALVGGWLGYFGAQVGRSDWDRVPTGEKTSLRQSYTAAGVGVGALLGYFLRPRVRASGALPQPLNIPARSGRQLFARTELRRSIATNALEAVEMDRPEWTKPQRDDEARQGAALRTGPVESISLVVYVGEERVGGIETLRDIAIPEVAELRFYDSRDARRRWGVEHRYGAIEVVPASTGSASAAVTVPVVPAADSTK